MVCSYDAKVIFLIVRSETCVVKKALPENKKGIPDLMKSHQATLTKKGFGLYQISVR